MGINIPNIDKLFVRIKNFLSKDVFRILGAVGFLNALKMVTAFVANKVVALYLGLNGMALIGQLWNFSNIVQTVSSGGIFPGVTKYVAEYRNDESLTKKFLITSFSFITINTIFISLILIVFSSYISLSILRSAEYSIVFVLFGLTLIFFNYNSLFLAIINGHHKYRYYVRINIALNLSNTILTIGLIYFFGIIGALISIVTGGSIVFFYSLNLLKHEDWFSHILKKISIYKNEFKQLLKFSLMTLVSAIINPLAQVFIRSSIIHQKSIETAGIWESINRMSSFYLLMITNTLLVYFIPKISALDEKLIKKEVNNFYKVILPLVLLIQLSIYFLRHFIVKILFSEQFIVVTDFMYIQLIGDFFKIATFVLSYVLVAKAIMLPFILTEIAFNAILVVLTLFGLHFYGLNGVFGAYILSYVLNFTIIFIYTYKIKFPRFQNS